MLSKEVKNLLNEQINKELYSAYLYLDMSNWYTERNLDGFANWFAVQAQEEFSHASLFTQYLHNCGEEVKLLAIGQPDKVFKDVLDPLTAALEHEQFVTASINNIYFEAQNAKDLRTQEFLHWFIKEQAEEEKNADELIQKTKLVGSSGAGLFVYDAELKTREYAPPSLDLD